MDLLCTPQNYPDWVLRLDLSVMAPVGPICSFVGLSYFTCLRFLHRSQILKSSKEWDSTEIWCDDSISFISFSRWSSKDSFNSKSSTAPQDLQKIWWWWSFFVLDSSMTFVLSGVWNSLIKLRSFRLLIILYKEDRASFPSDNLIISSTFKGPLFLSKPNGVSVDFEF